MAIFIGTDADEMISTGSGTDLIIAGGGNDTVRAGRGNDIIALGAGDDVAQWRVGDGSDLVLGGSGFDLLDIDGNNAAESFTLGAGAAGARLTRDIGNDTIAFAQIEVVDIATAGGADRVLIEDLSGTCILQVALDLGGADGHADRVQVNGTQSDDFVAVVAPEGTVAVTGLSADVLIAGTEPARDQLVIKGLGGNDVISAESAPISLVLDGGDGDDVILGGGGDDLILGGSGSDLLTGGDGDDVTLGGAGDDVITAGVGTDVIVTGAGQDLVLVQGAAGTTLIADFAAGVDGVRLEGFFPEAPETLVRQVGDDVVIDLDAHVPGLGTIVILSATLAAIGGDILFV